MVKGKFLSFYFTIPSRGLRFYTARITRGKGATPNIVFKRDRFKLYSGKGSQTQSNIGSQADSY